MNVAAARGRSAPDDQYLFLDQHHDRNNEPQERTQELGRVLPDVLVLDRLVDHHRHGEQRSPHEKHERALITAMLGHPEEQDDGDRGVHGVEGRLGNEAVRTALVQLERVVGSQEVQERTEQREPPAPCRRQAGGKQRERARGSPHDDVQLTDDARVEGQRRACLLAQVRTSRVNSPPTCSQSRRDDGRERNAHAGAERNQCEPRALRVEPAHRAPPAERSASPQMGLQRSGIPRPDRIQTQWPTCTV